MTRGGLSRKIRGYLSRTSRVMGADLLASLARAEWASGLPRRGMKHGARCQDSGRRRQSRLRRLAEGGQPAIFAGYSSRTAGGPSRLRELGGSVCSEFAAFRTLGRAWMPDPGPRTAWPKIWRYSATSAIASGPTFPAIAATAAIADRPANYWRRGASPISLRRIQNRANRRSAAK